MKLCHSCAHTRSACNRHIPFANSPLLLATPSQDMWAEVLALAVEAPLPAPAGAPSPQKAPGTPGGASPEVAAMGVRRKALELIEVVLRWVGRRGGWGQQAHPVAALLCGKATFGRGKAGSNG